MKPRSKTKKETKTALIARFLIQTELEGECLVWRGSRTPNGYGRFNFNGHNAWAHRVSYELFVGPIPAGEIISHYRMDPGPEQDACSTSCIEPTHLRSMTQIENIRRAFGFATGLRLGFCRKGHPMSRDLRRGGTICMVCRKSSNRAWAEKQPSKGISLKAETS